MNKNLKLIIVALLSLSFLYSCKSTQPDEPDFSGGGRDDLQPAPDPEPTPIPDDPPAPPRVETWSLEGDDISKEERKETPIPYRTWFVKTINLNQNVENKKCVSGYEDRCVVNRQLLFQFRTEEIQEKYPTEFWSLKSARLTGSYYSVGKNNRTELLCLLNANHCSGQGILKNWFGKLIWWSSKFWTKKYDHIVKNKWFNEFLIEGYDATDKLYIRRDETVNLLDIFPVRLIDMERYVRKDKSVKFSITDDTYIEDPILHLEFIERKRYGDTNASP